MKYTVLNNVHVTVKKTAAHYDQGEHAIASCTELIVIHSFLKVDSPNGEKKIQVVRKINSPDGESKIPVVPTINS